MKQQGVSKLQVLQAISDEITLDIFNEMGKNPKTSDNLIQIVNITRKQYYTRSSRIINAGLIKRKAETCTLTSFGRLIYHAEGKVARAAHHAWKLKVMDSLSSNSKISDSVNKDVIDKLIDDPEMKGLILFKVTKQLDTESVQ